MLMGESDWFHAVLEAQNSKPSNPTTSGAGELHLSSAPMQTIRVYGLGLGVYLGFRVCGCGGFVCS